MAKMPDEQNKQFFGHRDELDSMFKIFSRLNRPVVLPSDSRWIPEVDVFETDEDFVVIFDLAHINPRDIDIVYSKKSLSVKGVRREITKFKKRHYHKMEIDYGPFERVISVPVPIDDRDIKTQYKDGFLEVRLKKMEERRGSEKSINIEWQE